MIGRAKTVKTTNSIPQMTLSNSRLRSGKRFFSFTEQCNSKSPKVLVHQASTALLASASYSEELVRVENE